MLNAYELFKANLTVPTTRLLKSILPAACLWTGLRDVEGFNYDKTISELRSLYPPEDVNMDEDEENLLPDSVPESIREMVRSKSAIQALGSMIWCVLNAHENSTLILGQIGICDNSTSIKTF